MLDILIVEDNKEIGELLATFLRKNDYAEVLSISQAYCLQTSLRELLTEPTLMR